MKKYKEIESEKELLQVIESNDIISTFAFQNLDFGTVENIIGNKTFIDCIFLGCKIPENLNSKISKDCLVFPNIEAPYNPFINCLYTPETLFANYEYGNPESYEKTLDKIVYNHYIETGKLAVNA